MAPDTRVVPFADAHLPAAAALVAERHARIRTTEAALDERWSDPAEARTLVEAALARPHAEGFVALHDGDPVGFLVGELRLEAPWDRAGWVDLAGHAMAEHAADAARDLFAAWSRRLVPELGVFRYLVNVPVDGGTAGMAAWHELGFGQMHAYAIRSTDASDLAPSADGIRVRRATPDDAAVMADASELIWREQAGPPSWSPITPEQALSLRADFVEELSLDDAVFLAEDAASGEALGISVTYPMEPELDIPTGSWKLASTATFDAARRRGAGRALVHAVLRNAADHGASTCVTDWRTSSLVASRTWPALGWRRTRVRLERRVDERMAWADGRW